MTRHHILDAPEHYILDGHKPVPVKNLMLWARWFEVGDRRVAVTDTDNGQVSTVFLGIDHSFSEDGPPVLFETMVFGGTLDGEQERYTTWEEAEAGHRKMVERVKGEGDEGN